MGSAGLRWNDQSLPHHQPVGVVELVGFHQSRGGHMVAVGDFCQGIPGLDSVENQNTGHTFHWVSVLKTGLQDYVKKAQVSLFAAISGRNLRQR